MPKNKRKRKLKEQDFKKVKLKVGKRLQAAQNATDTSFKSRAIFVPSQLSGDGEPTNQRNQNLKQAPAENRKVAGLATHHRSSVVDLLGQVGHYSASTRREALVGLRDLFQLHENVLHENLPMIVKRVAEKMTDSDASVRQALVILLSYIFPAIPQDRMGPFCPLLLAHLSCAMSHIDDKIQHDSLNFLELCLQCFPECMVLSSHQLTWNFLGMISHQTSGSVNKREEKGRGRGLSINPQGKLSSPKSRLKVLQHLLAFLKALESSTNPSKKADGFLSSGVVCGRTQKPVVVFQKQRPTQVQILQHSAEQPTVIPFTLNGGVSLTFSSKNSDNKSNILSHAQQVQDLMKTIVPLLLECWIECNPAQMTTGLPDSIMSSPTILLMQAITDVLNIIFKAAQRTRKNFQDSMSDLSKNSGDKSSVDVYLKDLNQHFMAFFPFLADCSTPLRKVKGKVGKSWRQSTCTREKYAASVLELNFAVCEIMMQFLHTGHSMLKDFHISIQKLEVFVIESLEIKANGGVISTVMQMEHVDSLIKFVDQLLQFRCCVKQDSGAVRELLDAAYKLYHSSHNMSSLKRTLLQFFASLVFSENHLIARHEVVLALTAKWLPSLPSLLKNLKDRSPDMTEVVLTVLKKAVVQGVLKPDGSFISNLAGFFSKNTGSFMTLSKTLQRLAVELLFHLPSVDDQFLHILAECCQTLLLQETVIQYLLQVLHYRSPCHCGLLSHPAAFSLASYLSFLLSVATGISKKHLNECQAAEIKELSQKQMKAMQSRFVILAEPPQGEQLPKSSNNQSDYWEQHKRTLQCVCYNYRQSLQSHDFLQLMSVAVQTFLADFSVLPVSAVYSLLCVVKCLVELASCKQHFASPCSCALPTDLLSSLAELSLVSITWSTKSCSTNAPKDAEKLAAVSMVVKQDLVEAVLGLLCTEPSLATEMVSLMHKIVAENCEPVKHVFAEVLTKLLTSGVRTFLLQSAAVVEKIVSLVLNSETSATTQTQCFADLRYQYDMFKIEARQA